MNLPDLIAGPIYCPQCSGNLRAVIGRGDEYCSQCGFEFRHCRHCQANVLADIETARFHCHACGRSLRPAEVRLPDDDFWEGGFGMLFRATIFIVAVVTLIGTCIVGFAYLVSLFSR